MGPGDSSAGWLAAIITDMLLALHAGAAHWQQGSRCAVGCKNVFTSSSESSHYSLTDHSSSLSHRAPGYSRFMSALLTGGRNAAVPPTAATVPTALHCRWETVTSCTGLTLDTGAVHRNTKVDVCLSLRGTRLCKIFRFLADSRSVRNRAC